MRGLFLCLFSLFIVTGCGTGLKRADTCEKKVYMGCPVGKLQCGTDDKGCKQCQCVL